MNPLEGSKTFKLVLVTIGAIMLLVLIGVVVQVFWGESVAAVVSAGIGGITGNSLGGITRNILVDSGVRQTMAQQAYGPPPASGARGDGGP